MGTFYVSCRVQNHVRRSRSTRLRKILVDTGSEHTWIAETALKRIGVSVEKKDISFIMANGQSLTRTVGFAVLRIGDAFTIDEVVFAQKGDLQLLGARTLEGMNLMVHPRQKKLIAAGPLTAA